MTTPPSTRDAAPGCWFRGKLSVFWDRSIRWWRPTTGWIPTCITPSFSFDKLFAHRGADPEYVPLPKFPAVTRDIAVLVDQEITVGALEACIHEAAQALLKEVALFDIYQGENLPAGKKSVAFNLVLRADDRSLTAQEADDEVKLILEQLGTTFGATLR